MKFKHFAILYGLTFLIFIMLLGFVPERVVYFMHDGYIEFSRIWAIIHLSYSFLLPLLLQFIINKFHNAHSVKVFVVHYIFSALSVLLLFIALIGAKDMVQDNSYGTMDFRLVLGYYFFKLLTFILICFLVFKTIFKKSAREN